MHQTKTVDLTPTWRDLLPALLALVEMDGTRQVALDELSRMAMAADQWNTHCKEIQANG